MFGKVWGAFGGVWSVSESLEAFGKCLNAFRACWKRMGAFSRLGGFRRIWNDRSYPSEEKLLLPDALRILSRRCLGRSGSWQSIGLFGHWKNLEEQDERSILTRRLPEVSVDIYIKQFVTSHMEK